MKLSVSQFLFSLLAIVMMPTVGVAQKNAAQEDFEKNVFVSPQTQVFVLPQTQVFGFENINTIQQNTLFANTDKIYIANGTLVFGFKIEATNKTTKPFLFPKKAQNSSPKLETQSQLASLSYSNKNSFNFFMPLGLGAPPVSQHTTLEVLAAKMQVVHAIISSAIAKKGSQNGYTTKKRLESSISFAQFSRPPTV